MDLSQTQFIARATQQAEQAGHVWPVMAACEAALESGWGRSSLAIQANNLFGVKSRTAPYVSLPTHEWIDEQWVVIESTWREYEDQAACFADRMSILRRMAPSTQNYATALAASTPEQYVLAVSRSWSTDPDRASKALAIYKEVTSSTTPATPSTTT